MECRGVGQLGVAFGVIASASIDQVELFEDPAESHGGRDPIADGVDHERDILADMRADGAHALHVVLAG